MIKSSNRPYQTSAPAAQTVTGSPYTYTNTSGTLQYVQVSGGLAVGVSLLGLSALSLTGAQTYILRPGDTITITYTTAPTVTIVNLL